jgi:hypothetical protein
VVEQRVIEQPEKAPNTFSIRFAAILTGVLVRFERGASQSDPFNQRGVREHYYPDLDEALAELPDLALNFVADLAKNGGVGESLK